MENNDRGFTKLKEEYEFKLATDKLWKIMNTFLTVNTERRILKDLHLRDFCTEDNFLLKEITQVYQECLQDKSSLISVLQKYTSVYATD